MGSLKSATLRTRVTAHRTAIRPPAPEIPAAAAHASRRRHRRWIGLIALLLGALAAQAGAPVIPRTADILTYHADEARSGLFVLGQLSWARAAGLHRDPTFRARIRGDVYAQPLYWVAPSGPQLLIATESDNVYALDARTGATLWQRTLGSPVPLAQMPCGDIDPLGITGTPVIDPRSATVYLDAMRQTQAGQPEHALFALALQDGSIRSGWPVSVGSSLGSSVPFLSATQNQRGALALLGHTLYVPYGGNFGDCGVYHGWVVGTNTDQPPRLFGWHTSARGGGIWAPGGVVIEGNSLLVATGNTMRANDWGSGEAVIRLTASLTFSSVPSNYFSPTNWRTLDARDADLGSVAPIVFDLGGAPRILALGKDRMAYLLDARALGGIGGALVAQPVADAPIRTAAAVYHIGPDVYVAFQGPGNTCPDAGLTVLRLRPTQRRIETAWCGAVDGRGSPIVTTTDGLHDPIVWILGADGDGRLYGFRGDNGQRLFQSSPLAGLRAFQTLIAVGNHLYVAADDAVYAFTY